MSSSIFDFDDNNTIFNIFGRIGMKSNGDMMMKMSDNMAMDLDSGELHATSSWDDDEDDSIWSTNKDDSMWDDDKDDSIWSTDKDDSIWSTNNDDSLWNDDKDDSLWY